LRIEK